MSSKPPKKKTVLVVDDSEDNRLLIEQILKVNHYIPILVENGLQALELIQGNKNIDLALVDVIMPGINGLELTRRLRALPLEEYIPVILLTALDDPSDIEKGLEAGADDYIVKPFNSLELKARMRNIVRIRQMENQLRENYKLMKTDLEAARDLQLGMIPTSPLVTPRAQFSWYYEPCHFVAGDMLNVFPLGKNCFGFYVADVSGHGVAAAMLSIWLSHTLKPTSGSRRDELSEQPFSRVLRSPSQTCEQLEQQLLETRDDKYLTMCYGIFCPEQQSFTFSRAGHPYPLYQDQEGKISAIESSGGPPIGMGLGLPFEEKTIVLENGTRLFLYTDGLLEAQSEEGDYFGLERFIKLLESFSSLPIAEQIQKTVDAVKQFQKDQFFEDDVTLFGLETKAG